MVVLICIKNVCKKINFIFIESIYINSKKIKRKKNCKYKTNIILQISSKLLQILNHNDK